MFFYKSFLNRALEEVLYAYCWMHLNFKMLGTSGRKVILGGNSAGANLAAGLFHLCAKHNLPKPDLIFLGYPSLLCQALFLQKLFIKSRLTSTDHF